MIENRSNRGGKICYWLENKSKKMLSVRRQTLFGGYAPRREDRTLNPKLIGRTLEKNGKQYLALAWEDSTLTLLKVGH